jgi:hypothetical protein
VEASVVWKVWRRILREAPLRTAMLEGRLDAMTSLNLGPAELEAAQAYGAEPVGVQMFVETYRYRMASSFFNALETAAPITRRVLVANDMDLRVTATKFLDEHDWFDFGPFVFSFGRSILDYLAADDAAMSISGLAELIELERAAIGVVMAAASGPVTSDSVPDHGETAGQRWRLRPWFALCSSRRDLSEWLRSPSALGRTIPPVVHRDYAIYLPSLDANRRIAAVPPRAAHLLRLLAQAPMTEQELAWAMPPAGHDHQPQADRQLLGRLASMALIEAPEDKA